MCPCLKRAGVPCLCWTAAPSEPHALPGNGQVCRNGQPHCSVRTSEQGIHALFVRSFIHLK